MTSITADAAYSYSWDGEGRPVSVTRNGTIVTLTYDALGRMVEQNRSGTRTQIIYSPTGGKLALMNGTTMLKAFVPLPAGQAVYTSSGLSHYRYHDWLGSSRLASTPSRTVYAQGSYAPYGEPYLESGTQDRSFTGQEQDTVSGLYDFMFRQFHPVQGRWISPDPLGIAAGSLAVPQSLNLYAYVMNQPLRFFDRLGLCAQDPRFDITVCADGASLGAWIRFVMDSAEQARQRVVGPGGGSNGPGGGGGILGRIARDVISTAKEVAKEVVQKRCETVPDVQTMGIGADIGLGLGANVQVGWAGDGKSGDLVLYNTYGGVAGVVSPSAYVYAGFQKEAPPFGYQDGKFDPPKPAVHGGIGRTGFAVSQDGAQFSFGASLVKTPALIAVSGSKSNEHLRLPWLGYIANPMAAVCQFVSED